MKKILSLWLILMFSMTLYSCVEITYEGVYQTYESYLEDHSDDYESLMTFYNTLTTMTIKGTVTIKSTVEVLDYSAIGSGFIYLEDDTHYYALTNSHVVGANLTFNHSIQVTDITGDIYPGTLIAFETDYDIAVIQFAKEKTLPVFEFALANVDHRVNVFVLGHPDGQINGLMMGEYLDMTTVSLSEQSIGTVDFQVLKLNVPVQPGSSGSVVINEDYLVVGMVFAGSYNDHSQVTTYSYAIPVEKILEYLEAQDLMAGNPS